MTADTRSNAPRRPISHALALGAILGALLVALIVSSGVRDPGGSVSGPPSAATAPAAPPTAPAVPAAVAAIAASASTPSVQATTLDLSITDAPSSICVDRTSDCPAGVGVSRVTLTASAPPTTFETWPSVQVAFVVETTLYDGVYDPEPDVDDPGHDQCAVADTPPSGPACEESNGVPFFVHNAQSIANAIQAANPHTTVSFALVDYFATLDQQDDGDGSEYHVDIPQFVPAGQFGADVSSSLGTQVLISGDRYYDSDFSDNILHSSSITALYGTIIGSGLDWSNDTHHVIVWMGSTAPRDPNYEQDYCVSPSDYYPVGGPDSYPCNSSGCEPSYPFGTGASPQCEGWVNSQNGNATDSIAALARTSPTCTDSVGRECTIDMIDLWATPTDPTSPGWPAGDDTPGLQGGPGGPAVEQNTERVLLAGCDLAAATGGTWDGPSFFSCPTGQTGTLQPEFLGPYGNPNLQNPSLFAAFRSLGFGPVTSNLVALGTNHPLFTFVPWGSIRVLPGQLAQFRTACLLGDGNVAPNCPTQPVTHNLPLGPGLNVTVYGWNWSSVPSENQMVGGDTWIASFWIMSIGPPYGVVPVDACKGTACSLGNSGVVGGVYTAATYIPPTNITEVIQSFPLAVINVEAPPSTVPPPTLPSAPPAVPPPAILAPAGLPILASIGVGAQVGVASLSLQAAAAGFVAAGFTSISVRNRPLSIQVAQLRQKTPPVRSRFEETASSQNPVGRFE